MSPNALSPADALANVFSERKQRTKLGLSKYAVEAAEQAEEHRDKLGIAGEVKDVADFHKTLWPAESQCQPILNLAVLLGRSGRNGLSGTKAAKIELKPQESKKSTLFPMI